MCIRDRVHDVLYTEEIGQKVLREQHIIDEMDAALAEQQLSLIHISWSRVWNVIPVSRR